MSLLRDRQPDRPVVTDATGRPVQVIVDDAHVAVEAIDARVRITVEAGAPAETVTAVLGLLLPRGPR